MSVTIQLFKCVRNLINTRKWNFLQKFTDSRYETNAKQTLYKSNNNSIIVFAFLFCFLPYFILLSCIWRIQMEESVLNSCTRNYRICNFPYLLLSLTFLVFASLNFFTPLLLKDLRLLSAILWWWNLSYCVFWWWSLLSVHVIELYHSQAGHRPDWTHPYAHQFVTRVLSTTRWNIHV